MTNPKILIYYSPRLYAELFSSVLRSICGIEIVDSSETPSKDAYYQASRSEADIIITSLDDRGRPAIRFSPTQASNSKILAFCPSGKIGMRRMPHSRLWEEISPFGLDQLIREVIYTVPIIKS